MRWFARMLMILFPCAALTGCVERRFIVESNPPAAAVYKDGQFMGATPVEIPFQYYGKHEFDLIKEGYETRKFQVQTRAPWFQWFPLDFFSENVWPGHIQDNRRLQFELEPQMQPRTEDVLNEARTLRERGQALPAPRSAP
jgi:hypothetical protein